MNRSERDQWNNRPMVVTVRERCDACGELCTGVEERSVGSGWFTKAYRSCYACAETEDKRLGGMHCGY